ncbi:tetratricopeptide repeat protein [Tanticharoenia sakaeratensis]|uniref:Thioredoxin n=1 Tax=Tanticharoenia sakaeratensis NBRC 103193 TaxID=1231623 RepID=A0A0D6MNC2_9PROT|nr:tetratricopeptide repeat protein [Tanticharoenia sakaeratensis]GAN54900.1 thioredoxin [Tanticharoenia sakaeratensis NBRC 103193]
MDYIIGQGRSAPAAPGTIGSSGAPMPGGAGRDIVDADERTFMAEVIDASRDRPVLVDFWAPWCGPCKTLTPVIERVVTAAAGRVKLVKVDIEANRTLAAQLTQLGLPLQSIPMVAAFWQGQILDIFQGALPESEVKRFVEALLKASGGAMPAADVLAGARQAMQDGHADQAAALFGQLLEVEPENPDGWAGMVRALIALDDDAAAEDALSQVPEKLHDHPEISGARSALELHRSGRKAASELDSLRAAVEAAPQDHDARMRFAEALNGAGHRAEAADELLSIVRADRAWNDGAAKAALLRLFEAWGHGDPATLAARRKLSALLFS